MKEFEIFGCLLEFLYFLNPFVEILSGLLVLMLIEADCSYYSLDLGLRQIGHTKIHKIKKFSAYSFIYFPYPKVLYDIPIFCI